MNKLECIVDFYQELVMQDFAIMRGNYPALDIYTPPNMPFSYFVNSFPSFANKTDRAMDLLILIFAIINSAYKKVCNIDIHNTISINHKCNNELIINYIKEKAYCVNSNVKTKSTKDNDVLSYIYTIIDKLIDTGLLHIIPENIITKEDNINPYKYINILNNTEISVDTLSDIVSLKVSEKINGFLNNILDKNLDIKKIEKTLKQKYRIVGKLWFKTSHGELIRLLSNAGSLPNNPANYESLILPFITEPVPSTYEQNNHNVNIEALEPILKNYFTHNNKKNTIDEKIVAQIVESFIGSLKASNYNYLSNYQFDYLKKILNPDSRGQLILITSPTGSGKTLIFSIYIIAKILKTKLKNKKSTSMLIYPRKSLARDQLEKLLNILYALNKSLEKNNLSHFKIHIAIRDRHSLTKKFVKNNKPYTDLRGIVIKVGNNPLKVCHMINDTEYNTQYKVFLSTNKNCTPNNNIETVDWIFDIKEGVCDVCLSEADIIITNYSMLSKSTYEAFSKNIVWKKLFEQVDTIVLDEAHTYLQYEELLVIYSILIKLMYLKGKKKKINNIQKMLKEDDIDIILSSATISNNQLLRYVQGKNSKDILEIDSKNILGIITLPKCSTILDPHTPPNEVLEYSKSLLGSKLFQFYKENGLIVYNDYVYSIFCSNIQKFDYKGRWRLKLAAITFPVPTKISWTSLTEGYITLLHWLLSLRNRANLKKLSSVIFIDSKETITHIIKIIASRNILEAQDHVDRILLTPLFPNEYISNILRRKAHDQITKVLIESNSSSLFDILWDIGKKEKYFSRFQHLSLYLPSNELIDIKFQKLNLKEIKETLDKKLKHLEKIVTNINSFASDFLNYKLEDIINKPYDIYYFIYHHADIKKRERSYIEEFLANGKVLTVFSTSTLEVGVDIPGLGVAVQFGATANTAELQQRLGRAGRSLDSLYISTGILILRNTGQDIGLLDEGNAINYVFNLTLPNLNSPEHDELSITRYLSPLIIDMKLDISAIAKLLAFHGFSDKKIINIIGKLDHAHENVKQLNNLYEKSNDDTIKKQLENCIYDLRDIIERKEGLEPQLKKQLIIINKKLRFLRDLDEKADNEPIFLYFIKNETIELIDWISDLLIYNQIRYQQIEDLLKNLRRILHEIDFNITREILGYRVEFLKHTAINNKKLEEIKKIEIKNQVFPGIPSLIGTHENIYRLIKLEESATVSKHISSFQEFVRNILPLKTIKEQ